MKKEYELRGIDCGNCAAKIERAVNQLEQVESATVNLIAQKLILELKDKMDLQEAFDLKSQHVQEAQGDMADLSDARKEAVEALTALGYSGADALRAVKKVEMTPGMDVETLLKAALKNLF